MGVSSFQKCYTCFHWNVEWKSTKEWNWYLPATNTWNKSIEIPEIWLDVTILQGIASKLFRNESYIIRKYNIVAFQNCFSYFDWNVERESRRLWTFSFSSDQLFFEHGVARALTRLGRPCATHLSSSFNNRAVQTNCSETCYISSKSWDSLFSEMLNLFHWNVEWMSTKEWNWYLPATNTWNESIEIPEIWLDFTILQRVANILFRNESYMTRKFNILVFQNCFSYFHWNDERESRRLWTVSFSSDQLFFEQEMTPGAYTHGTPLCDASFSFFKW